MSLIAGLLATCLHAAPTTFAVAFSLLLVVWLVMAEEVDLRRGRGAEVGHPVAAASAPRASSSTV